MENLWSTSIIPTENESGGLNWNSRLPIQAAYLEAQTMGIIQTQVELHLESGVSQRFFLWPRGQQQMRYELLRIRSANGSFPVVIETYHMGENSRYVKVVSVDELNDTLKNIFRNEQTIRIIQTLANEAVNDVVEDASQPESPGDYASPLTERPLLIGALFKNSAGDKTKENEFSQVNILGVAGFISVDVIRGLTKRPDSGRDALIQKLNDRFVVTLKFADSVKMTLSATELKHLQAQAKKVLEVNS